MDRTFLAVSAATVVLLAGGVAAGVFLTDTGVFDDQPRVDAAVTGFSGGNATCVDEPATEPRVTVGENTTRGAFLILRANVTVGSPDTRIENATLRETGLANYTLTYETTGGGGACPSGETAVAYTQTVFQLPQRSDAPFGVTVLRGDETLFRLRNGPNGLRVANASA
ncbi:hypothetical protein [Halosegnis marinus]|uniref:DUF4352 domain-containing protein n=1 Tax=Halosegnis marinus TaxID=3034023 RepID=A0ABD5ZQX7_9EURY|nr:hypothetical protein [Halosegnis sp. DT85]